MLGISIKEAGTVQDYDIDFSAWMPPGDTIDTCNLSTDEGIDVEQFEVYEMLVKVWIGGGENKKDYMVKVTAITKAGRIKEVYFKIRVRN